jgi:MFS family permease
VTDSALDPAVARRPGALPKPVWLLGWVSFSTDAATEMVYPLLPVFLTRVLGASVVSLGVIEGVADAATSALKIASGWLADRRGRPRSLVLAGYALSSAVRPLIGLAMSWVHVLSLRFADRLGKGIRGAPRDAMLAAFAPPGERGRVFGFHRAMDHAGAVVGPLVAAAVLAVWPDRIRTLFALTLVPGAIAVGLVLWVPAGRDGAPRPTGLARPSAGAASWHDLPRGLYTILFVLFVFGLGNSTDAFLLLQLSERGMAAAWLPLLWAALHVVKAGSSAFGGRLSDRWGRRGVIGAGWLVYAAVYAGFAAAGSLASLVTLFLVYGLYFGLTEGVEKALVADIAPAGLAGTAFGLYNGAVGISALTSSLVFAGIWTLAGPAAAFAVGAGFAVLAVALLFVLVGPAPRRAVRSP